MAEDKKFGYVFTFFVAIASAAIGAVVTVALDKSWERLIPIEKTEIQIKNDNRLSNDHPPSSLRMNAVVSINLSAMVYLACLRDRQVGHTT